MKRWLHFGSLVCCAALLVASNIRAQNAAPNVQPGKPALSVEQILDRATQASGGQAWSRINSMYVKGEVELPPPAHAPTYEIYAKAPSKLLQTITLANGAVMHQSFDGATGWHSDPQIGVQDLKGNDLADLKQDAYFNEQAHLKEIYPQMTYEGETHIDARATYVVRAVTGAGRQRHLYFDEENGLWVGVSAATTASAVPAGTYYSDFRETNGIRVPYLIRLVAPDVTMTVHVQDVQINLPIDDSVFAKPVTPSLRKP